MLGKNYNYPPPNEATLRNKFGIKDFARAMALERDITAINLTDVGSVKGCFDTAHIKAVHKHLFGDMYDWAGQFRKVNIYKEATSFCDVRKLDTWFHSMDKQLPVLNVMQPGISVEDASEFMAKWFRAYNYGHPFREGNGRTGRVMLVGMAKEAGYDLLFSGMSRVDWMDASKASRFGNTDIVRDMFKYNLFDSNVLSQMSDDYSREVLFEPTDNVDFDDNFEF